MNKIKIAPSILSADFGKLKEEIKEVEPYSDLLHLDFMDGTLVPEKTFDPSLVGKIDTALPLDVHLMVSEPVRFASEIIRYNKNIRMLSFHPSVYQGNSSELEDAIRQIRTMGRRIKVGLALNPDEPLSLVNDFLDRTDYIIIMSVYAGKGGQKFIPDVLDKIRELRGKYNYKKDIEIDGGINIKTAKSAVEAGATILVAGSAIFKPDNREYAIRLLRDSYR
jgi:ribulose-phosphate 3-epimerase